MVFEKEEDRAVEIGKVLGDGKGDEVVHGVS